MIDINSLIDENLMCLDIDLKSKDEVLETMANVLYKEGKLINYDTDTKDGFLKALWDRENTFSTAVGFSFGIPHGKCEFVKDACIAYARLKEEIKWAEDENVKYIFMIGVSSEKAGNEHLEILIKLSTSILDSDFREKLVKAKSTKETLDIIKEFTNKERKN